ncbi:Alpha/beta hydrolase family protein [Geodermatophilus obscurus]|uniref:Alpha/beta hydrolase family protein n=1 Tax=Geodermatophilus obscurus TaxID=1861 RepID=A0A1M7TE44_9ACTN|nr:alpha/beta hydrolase [Geodermatophilus obscurus]SHN68957.1 Alpha/beta hydrolase family protein [Geodermatophilus obscurus]
MSSASTTGQHDVRATFLLVPGAGGRAWYWHRLVPELRARGSGAIAVDLPAGDDDAGLEQYTQTVLDAAASCSGGPLVVVGQSMGGLTAPLVCTRVQVDLLVLLNAMVPRPGETGGEWWTATGHEQARTEAARAHGWPLDDDDAFLHDVPPEVVATAPVPFAQSGTPFAEPWPLRAWPGTPTRVLAGRDDRFFPVAFQRRVVGERLGLPVEELPGGHLVALSRPAELADRLVGSLSALSVADR